MPNPSKFEEKRRQDIQDDPMDIYHIRMTAWHARIARTVWGGGNLSRGIRRIIEAMAKYLKDAEQRPK